MEEVYKFYLGVGGATLSDYVWKSLPGSSAFSLAAGDVKSPLAFVEHYHLGMASMILAPFRKKEKMFLYGLGAGLAINEMTHDHAFGIGKSEAEVRGNVMLTALLGGLALMAHSK